MSYRYTHTSIYTHIAAISSAQTPSRQTHAIFFQKVDRPRTAKNLKKSTDKQNRPVCFADIPTKKTGCTQMMGTNMLTPTKEHTEQTEIRNSSRQMQRG